MSAAPEDEAPRTSEDPRFRDAVTFSFGDPATRRYGLARAGVGAGGASGLAIVYADNDAVAGSATGAVAIGNGDSPPSSWDSIRAAGVRCTVLTPLQAWTVSYEGDAAAFDLRFEAVSAPAVLAPGTPVAGAGGMEGYEQLCAVTGTVSHGGQTQKVRCLGQRGHLWGVPDWERIALARTLSAWMGSDRAVTLAAVRPARARHHDDEAVAAWAIEGGEPLPIADARLSTTYDGELRQQRAGLELWMQEEGGFARRAAGTVVCGTTVDLGDVRLDSAFLHWRMEGREGTGRYDVLRRTSVKRRR